MTTSFRDIADELSKESELQAELSALKKRLKFYEGVPADYIPHTIPKYSSEKGAAIAVALLSDVHCEERVNADDVPGTYNVYNPQVCKKRIEQYAQRVILLTEAQRALTGISTLVLGVLGDIITGHIHDDNKESNWLSPTQATLFGLELLTGVIEHLLKNGKFQKVVVVCTPGNHGRTTMKPRAATAIQTNYEWMMYQLLKQRLSGHQALEWHIAGGAHVYLELGGKVCRFFHGDDANYQGGIGGLSIPLMKATSQWDRIRPADLNFLGHFHTCRDFGHIICNGSVIGYNAYALKAKCSFEPPKQAYVLLDSKRGKSLFADIWCDYLPPR